MRMRRVSGLVLGVILGLAAWGWVDPQGRHAPGGAAALAAPAHGQGESGGSGHGGASGSEINPLDFKTDLALYTLVVFLVLMGLLWRYAWGPIAQGLDNREKRIAGQISSAEQANAEARRLLQEYQAKLAGSETEVRAIIERGRREAEDLGRELLDKTRQEARREKERALREIDDATAGALKELAERSADLAVELAGKIVQAKVDRAEHARLVEQAVAGFGKLPPGKN